jgi:hypothetical protein
MLHPVGAARSLRSLLGLHGADSGRIFPVWMSPAEGLPPVFKDLVKYKLWYQDERRQPRTRWLPSPDPTDREYGNIQQDLARDMAARLRTLFSEEPEPRPAPRPAADLPQPAPQLAPKNGDHLVLVNGGEDDSDLVRDVAARLTRDHGIGSVVPISALPNRQRYKSSDLTRDLRDKLKLASAVLVVYRQGPPIQVHHQIGEFLKHTRCPPKDRPAPTLDLCQAGGEDLDLGFHPAQMRVHCVDGDCAGDCVRRFIAGLAP